MTSSSAGRHAARERALGLLYEAEVRELQPATVLDDLVADPDAFAVEIVSGVAREMPAIDECIARNSHNWRIGRMPIVDRVILRIGAFELMAMDDVPTAVVIDEAVELAKTYSTEESGGFVNGVLSAVATEVRG